MIKFKTKKLQTSSENAISSACVVWSMTVLGSGHQKAVMYTYFILYRQNLPHLAEIVYSLSF